MNDNARLIRQKVNTARVVEAGALLKIHKYSLSQQEQIQLQALIKERTARARQLVQEAKKAESSGMTARALELMHSAARIVGDDPETQAKLAELEDAVNLTRAFQKKVERREPPVVQEKQQAGGGGKLLIMGLVGMIVGISAGWFLTGKKTDVGPPTVSEQASRPQAVQQVEMKRPSPPAVSENTPGPQQEKLTAESPQPVRVEKRPPAITTTGNPLSPSTAQTSKKTFPQAEKAAAPVVPPVPVTGKEKQPALASTPPPVAPVSADVENARETTPPAPPPETAAVQQPDLQIPPVTTASAVSTAAPTAGESPSPASAALYENDPQTVYYIIQPGDNLSTLADRLFCYEPGWKVLFAMNKDIIQDPHFVLPGTRIRLQTADMVVENKCKPSPSQETSTP